MNSSTGPRHQSQGSVKSPHLLQRCAAIFALIPLELLPFLYMISTFLINTSLIEYIQQRTCDDDPGYLTNHTTAYCNSAAVTGPASSFYDKLNLISTIPAIFVTTFCGKISDKYGRQPILFVTIVAMFLRALLLMAIVEYTLPLEYTFIGEVVSGLLGGSANFLMAAFSGAADNSTPANRVWKVSLLEASLFAGEIVGVLIQGYVVDHFSFFAAFHIAVWVSIAAALLTLLMAEPLQTVHRSNEPLTFKNANPLAPLAVFLRSRCLFCLGGCFCFGVSAFVGYLASATLFFRTALGWSPSAISYFSTADLAARAISILAVLPLLQWLARRYLPVLTDRRIALLGYAAFGVQMAGYGLLQRSAATLALSPLGLISGLPVPVTRGLASLLVAPNEQGLLFSAIGATESVSSLIGGSAFPAIFAATAKTFLAATFLFGTAMSALAMLFLFFVREPKLTAGVQSIDVSVAASNEQSKLLVNA